MIRITRDDVPWKDPAFIAAVRSYRRDKVTWEDNGFTDVVRAYVKFRERRMGSKPHANDLVMLRLAQLELEARDEALA